MSKLQGLAKATAEQEAGVRLDPGTPSKTVASIGLGVPFLQASPCLAG